MFAKQAAPIVIVAGILAGANLIDAVHAQGQAQQSAQGQGAQGQGAQGQGAQGQGAQGQGAQGQGAQGQGTFSPGPGGRSIGLNRKVTGEDICQLTTTERVLPGHCEATAALLNFIAQLGLNGAPGSFPSCNLGLVSDIREMNLRVNAAIEWHKYSDRVLDPNRVPEYKTIARLKTDNDERINYIVHILRSYLERKNPSRTEFGGLIHYRQLIDEAEKVLSINFKLAEWGPDAAFLTAVRGYAIYQFVFNCVRLYDPRQAAARAIAMEKTANSHTYFLNTYEIGRPVRRPRWAFWRWWVEKKIIDGDTPLYGDGFFPNGERANIYLGSQFNTNPLGTPTNNNCPDPAHIKSYYGAFERTPYKDPTFPDYNPPPDDSIQLYKAVANSDNEEKLEGIFSNCEPALNSFSRGAINPILTDKLRHLGPAATATAGQAKRRLSSIVEAINEHIILITRARLREECRLGSVRDANNHQTPLPSNQGRWCSQNSGIASDTGIIAEVSIERSEYRVMSLLAQSLTQALSPELSSFEEWYRGRDTLGRRRY